MIATNAVGKAKAENIEDDETDESETEATEQTGPQKIRAVKRYCEAIKREAARWIGEESGEREKRKPVHWKLTEKHLTGGCDRKKSLYRQLTDCCKLLQDTWQQHIGVFSTSGHDYNRRQ